MRPTIGMLLLALLGGVALAEEGRPTLLRIGDPAPPLDVAHWIKGVEMDERGRFTPLTAFPKGRVTVLVFWATWSGVSRAGMPLLSELQSQYAEQGLRIIGLSDESLPKVYAFLREEGRDGTIHDARMRYTVATDPDGSVFRDYMEASAETKPPWVFVVGATGLIEWNGHPAELPTVLALLTQERWDRERARRENDARQRARRVVQGAEARLTKARADEDWEGFVRICDELVQAHPEPLPYQRWKLGVLMTKIDDRERAYACAEELRKQMWDDADGLNSLAWEILTAPGVIHRDLVFATRVAARAVEITSQQDAPALDTLARAYYERGDLVEAIRWQKRAVEAAREGMRRELTKTLAAYRGEHETSTE